MSDTPGVGWHLDPYRRHEQRYYDGSRWTEHIADRGATGVDHPDEAGTVLAPPRHLAIVGRAAAVSPLFRTSDAPEVEPYVAPRSITGPTILTGIGALLLAVGAFLPWVKVTSGFGSVEVSGVDAESGDGWVTLACGVIALLVLFVGNPKVRSVVALLAGAVGAWVAVSDLFDVRRAIDEMNRATSAIKLDTVVGLGLWGSVIGSGVLLLGASLMFGERD